MTYPLTARAATTTTAERSVSSGMAASFPAAAASTAVLRATGSSSTAFATVPPARGAGTPYAAASFSADAVAVFTALSACATGDDNAVVSAVAVLTNVRGPTAAESIVKSVTVQAAVCTTVETPILSGCIAPNEHHQSLFRCDRNNGINTPAERDGPAVAGADSAVSPESNDRNVRHARWYLEGLRSARVIECLVIRKRGVRGTARHDAVTGLAAASRKRGNSYADA
jgi:hypothetical protein